MTTLLPRVWLVCILVAACGDAPAPSPSDGSDSGVATDAADVPRVDAGEDDRRGAVSPTTDTVEASTASSVRSDASASADAGGDARTAGSDAVPCDPSERPCFQRPDSLRGLYVNAWSAGSARRMDQLIDLAARTEVNAFVIDVKDATGYVSHRSLLPGVRDVGADQELRIGDLPGLLRRLEAEGIYPIARIVIVKDPLLSERWPELAVQDTAGGIWIDSKEIVWLNLYDERVWDYHVELAREVAEMGFPEIQWDYVRFPDASASDLGRARFPGDSIGPKRDAVRGFLEHARFRLAEGGLGTRSTADVFGITTNVHRDVGIGQVWESFIDRVDAALPMVYPSHYWAGSFGFDAPNAHPYEIVHGAIEYAIRRSADIDSAGQVIPWLQDFTLGSPRYEGPEVRAQIQATYDAGASDWILWNPGSRYTEAALRPAEGWAEEPLVRVGGRVVPVSDRFEVLEAAPDSAPTESSVVPDSTGGRSQAGAWPAGRQR